MSAYAAVPRTLLLTGFEPFGGRPLNNSYEIAKRLQADPTLIGANIRVMLCELPVVYDRAAKVAEACFESLAVAPDAVVSLGEGGCDIRLETAATNLDNAWSPDNAGVLRRNRVIDPELPARVGFTLPVDLAYRARPESRTPVVPSISPGDYVCNNTAFLLAHYFRARNVPFGFIHLPPEDCAGGRIPRWKDTRLIGSLIGSALEASMTIPWPTDLEGIRELELMEQSSGAPVRDLEFLTRLEALYSAGDGAEKSVAEAKSVAEKVPARERGNLVGQHLVARPLELFDDHHLQHP
jgi:pyroglutamyl-peptidase